MRVTVSALRAGGGLAAEIQREAKSCIFSSPYLRSKFEIFILSFSLHTFLFAPAAEQCSILLPSASHSLQLLFSSFKSSYQAISIMVSSKITTILSLAALASAAPFTEKRTVTSLNKAAFAQAQQRDAIAVRAFSSIEIHSSDGRCLFVDELSGDFRANLNPIQLAACDGSTGQKWDIISSGKHNNVNGTMLVVNTLTQACMNFDARRAAGDQVIMFSCGGRADGSGAVSQSQLFSFGGQHGPDSFEPGNALGTCFTVKGAVLDQAVCVDGEASQQFVLGDLPEKPGTVSSGGAKEIDHGSSSKGSSSSKSSSSSSSSSTTSSSITSSSTTSSSTTSSSTTSSSTTSEKASSTSSSSDKGSSHHDSYHKGSSGSKGSYHHDSYHKGSSVEATSTTTSVKATSTEAASYNKPPPPPVYSSEADSYNKPPPPPAYSSEADSYNKPPPPPAYSSEADSYNKPPPPPAYSSEADSYNKPPPPPAYSSEADSYNKPPPPPAYSSSPEVTEAAKAIYSSAPACTPKVVTLTVPVGSPMPTQKY